MRETLAATLALHDLEPAREDFRAQVLRGLRRRRKIVQVGKSDGHVGRTDHRQSPAAAGTHAMSRARRMPVNCHRASGGKKFR